MPRFRWACAWSSVFLSALHAESADGLDALSRTAGELVRTRAEAVRIESRWAEERALLASTVDALKDRVARLEEKREHLLASTAEERAEREDLQAKTAAERALLAAAEKRLEALAAELLELRPQLPPRLSEALELSYRSLAAGETSPGERMQRVMTILNRCAQFNSTVTHDEEVLALPGESSPKAVEVLYWGLSHAYALDRPAGKVWLGSPAESGWRWEPLEGAVAAVERLIAIRRDEADPALVAVPARLKVAPTP